MASEQKSHFFVLFSIYSIYTCTDTLKNPLLTSVIKTIYKELTLKKRSFLN